MNVTPVQEIFRWRFRKKGTQVLNMCSHFFVFSGSLLALMAGSGMALANPSGGVVVGGSATISTTPTELQIHQHTDRALIEWNNFDIDAGETTRFVQPSITSIALNRVVNSNQLSRINGNLFANGRVIIVNPNGVLIGPNGNVDVAGFVATSADISNSDFMNGSNILTFNRAGRDDATVENNGRITVADTGIAALVAPTARNNGVINARLSKVHMAGADTFAVDFYGDGLINFAVGAKSGAPKRTLSSENNGTIIADGGIVSMTAADASDVVDSVINNKGTIQAQGLVSRNGEIILTGKGSTVKVSGKIDASATASGKAGSIKIGGDKQGQGSLARASNVTIDQNAVLMADAGDMGNGGTIILWADNNAFSRGQFYARGGKNGGNGGFVETSSPLFLDVDGTIVNTLAPFGNAGDWLLDPTNITIGTSGSTYNPANHSSAAPAGNVTINASTINSALSNVLLTATNNITFAANVAMTNSGVGFTANAGNDILINNNTLTTRRGAIALNAGHDIDIRNSTIDSNGANITLDANNDLLTRSTLFQSDGANISLNADDDMDLGAGSNFSTSGGDVTLRADEDMKLSGTAINTTGGIGSGSISVRDDHDSIIIPSELGNGNTFVSGGGGGDISISADNVLSNNNNNCFKAGGSSSSCTSIVANPIAITITADAKTKVYGSSDPLLTYLLSTTLASGSTVTGALSRASGENVGTYAINRGTLDIFGTTAYNITYVGSNLTITQKTLNILANAVNKVYGSIDPALTYTSNGLVGTDTITGALTRDAGSNVGVYAIKQGTLTASNNYAINFTGANFTITQKTLNVLANAVSKIYGDADPAFTYTYNGLTNGDTASVFAGALTRNAGENVGNYAINKGTLTAGGNYAINYTPANLTINKANLFVKADDKTKVYGNADPAFTVTFDGLKNGDTQSLFNVSTTREVGENVGNYAITSNLLAPAPIAGPPMMMPGPIVNGIPTMIMMPGAPIIPFDYRSNYNITTATGNLSITQKTLNILADAVTKVYGALDPTLTYAVDGLVSGDSITGSLARDAGENVGAHAINQGNVNAGNNYAINYVGNDLTITPKSLTVRADNKTKIYGSIDPSLTYTFDGLVNGDMAEDFDFSIERENGENVGNYEILLSNNLQQPSVALMEIPVEENPFAFDVTQNYDINIENGTFSITPKSLTVRADDKTKIYGSADPTLTYSFDGLVGDDSAEDFDISIDRSSGENVGRYRIFLMNNAQQEELAFFDGPNDDGPVYVGPRFDVAQNYDINLEGGTFSITPKSLILRADNKSKIVGSVDPALTYSFEGIVNGDENGDWRDIAISRAPGEAIGNYDINLQFVKVDFDDRKPDLATQEFERPFPKFLEFASQNYDITLENGIFSIAPVPTPTTSFGLLPITSFGGLGRPIISLADRILNRNPSFLPFILSGLNTDIGLLANGGNVPTNTGTPSATNLANIAPNAGDEDPSNVANIEPAAGEEEDNAPQNNNEQQNQNGSDINCANSFLDNKPCQDSNI